jgi:hypothetical protein
VITAAVITAISIAAAGVVNSPSEECAAKELSAACHQRMPVSRPQSQALEHLGGCGRPATAEDAEELLGAVADEERSHDDAKDHQREVHFLPPLLGLPVTTLFPERARRNRWAQAAPPESGR